MPAKQKTLDRALDDQVKQIFGATTAGGQSDGQLMFCIQLKGETKPIMATREEAKQKYPYHVLCGRVCGPSPGRGQTESSN